MGGDGHFLPLVEQQPTRVHVGCRGNGKMLRRGFRRVGCLVGRERIARSEKEDYTQQP